MHFVIELLGLSQKACSVCFFFFFFFFFNFGQCPSARRCYGMKDNVIQTADKEQENIARGTIKD